MNYAGKEELQTPNVEWVSSQNQALDLLPKVQSAKVKNIHALGVCPLPILKILPFKRLTRLWKKSEKKRLMLDNQPNFEMHDVFQNFKSFHIFYG